MDSNDPRWSTIANLLTILSKCSPDVLNALVTTVAGMFGGGVTALAVTSATATTGAVAFGPGAVALGGGATAVALKGGWALAIGAGASAISTGGVAVAIAPAVLAGISVGGLIGLLGYLVFRAYILSGKNKTD